MSETTAEQSRFVIGIDLGTTNSAVSYCDTKKKRKTIATFLIPQWVAAHQMETRETLPSFHYEVHSEEIRSERVCLPFEEKRSKNIVGVFARDHGGKVAGRLASSAKSWLSHNGVDRTAKLLPWQPADDVERISPVEVTARYLSHLRKAWNHRFPDFPMESQDLVITLPASFDEVARELTIRAAKQAGLPKIVLLEEPQAAFYAWVYSHAKDWNKHVSPGQKILICDIGGGTTDFTLIRVRATETGMVRFHRVAVGDHLILGGDNLDLALAHLLESKLGDAEKIPARNWGLLVRIACSVKEKFLGTNPPEKMTVHLPGTGAKLIGGGQQIEVTREEIETLLIEGFLPRVPFDSVPTRQQLGIREMGLPFAADHAMTKYLAHFLKTHRTTGMTDQEIREILPTDDPARPDILLLNGGMFEASKMQKRLLDVLADWFGREPLLLDNERLDLAVARGAAYYGMVRRGLGEKISAGLARTYYIGVASETDEIPMALCLLPAGTEVDHEVRLLDRIFELRVGEPIRFPIYVSSVRMTDRAGDLVPFDPEQMSVLPSIQTVIRTRRKHRENVAVHLEGRLTEIGTLELWCVETSGKGRWRLDFDVRSATQTERESRETTAEQEGVFDEETWLSVRESLEKTFGPEGREKPSLLMKQLVDVSGMKPEDWPSSLLRRMGDNLMESLRDGRRQSPEHESRFLNLLGYTFRPGFGLAMDDWRNGTALENHARESRVQHLGVSVAMVDSLAPRCRGAFRDTTENIGRPDFKQCSESASSGGSRTGTRKRHGPCLSGRGGTLAAPRFVGTPSGGRKNGTRSNNSRLAS